MRYEDKRFLHPQEACFGQMKRLPLSGELARRSFFGFYNWKEHGFSLNGRRN